MKHHKIDIQFHMGTNRKENADKFIEAYLALIEEELSGGAFTKKRAVPDFGRNDRDL